jgi:hypothetical protein
VTNAESPSTVMVSRHAPSRAMTSKKNPARSLAPSAGREQGERGTVPAPSNLIHKTCGGQTLQLSNFPPLKNSCSLAGPVCCGSGWDAAALAGRSVAGIVVVVAVVFILLGAAMIRNVRMIGWRPRSTTTSRSIDTVLARLRSDSQVALRNSTATV